MGIFQRRSQFRTWYKDVSKTLKLEAADTPTTVGANFIVGKAGYTIFVQSIVVHVITAAAQAISFTDDGGTPKEIAALPAAAAAGDSHILLSSEEGVPLTEGANLDITGAAGVEAMIVIEAYLKQTAALSVASVAAAG